MICFDNKTGLKGEAAEKAMEQFKKEELRHKPKFINVQGQEVPVPQRRNYASSERSVRTGMTNVSRAEDARETIQKKRKYKNTDT